MTKVIIAVYIIITLRLIGWGIPGWDHPFTYHMDEWHQMQAVKAVFKTGTPNIEGAANGTIFHFVISGLFLSPFVILGIVNPFDIKSSVGSLLVQQKLFEIMRLNTLMFGILAIWVLTKIAKQLKISSRIAVVFFTITPVWLSLSNYFKYDIALIFWILLSIYRIFEFARRPSLKNYVFAAIPCALAIATKVSAIPILPVYIFSYFLYIPDGKKGAKTLGLGILTFILVFGIFGIGDVWLGRGSYYEYFYSNLISTPNASSNYNLGSAWWQFLIWREWPALFGHFAYLMFVLATGYVTYLAKKTSNKDIILILVSLLLFAASLAPLKLSATGNRVLVLLPFLAIIVGISLQKLSRSFLVLVVVGMIFQITESYAWIEPKLQADQRGVVSDWLLKNVEKESIIGIENIPIYQMMPDLIIKEFYSNQYGLQNRNYFKYLMVDAKITELPETLVITDAEVAVKYFRSSEKKDLVLRLRKEGYIEKRFDTLTGIYRYFGDDKTFFFSGLVAAPVSISVFTTQTI